MAYNFVREPLNSEEYDRLINACWSFREKLVVWTLLDTGLRISEFCNLGREQIQWQENQIVVWGKGGRYGSRRKRRVVPLTLRVKKLFELYFATNNRVGLSVRSSQRLIKKVANRAAITKPVTPHVLRHTFAVNCVKRSLSIASLRKLLGHDRLETTAIYLNICPEDALGEFFQKVEGTQRQLLTWAYRVDNLTIHAILAQIPWKCHSFMRPRQALHFYSALHKGENPKQ